MAPIFVTTIPMPEYPSITRIFHYPTATDSVASTSSTPLSSTALDVVLILVIVLALLAAFSIVWLCSRRLARNPEPGAAVEVDVTAKNPTMTGHGRAHVIPETWDSSHRFWTKYTVPSSNLILSTENKMNDTLLAEVPNVWRILGRPNAAEGDAEEEDGEAIPTPRKTAS
ncbi:hypothetical protein B0H11DRAFT_2182194 [Mycena galericulata]|nr:hypothetical protein B0H11DRAFT_2182194 [Mycena galericulata]